MTKRLIKSFLYCIVCCVLIFMAFSAFSCAMDESTIGGNEKDFKDSKNWMSNINDTRKLFTLSIPGTHDTCANYDFLSLSSTAAAQDLSLYEQLNAGVRVLDIRPYHEKNGTYTIHHGVAFQHLLYTDVLKTCYKFLDENPTECIIFSIYNENRTRSEDSNIENMIVENIEKNNEYYLALDHNKLMDITIKDARGKMIVVYRLDCENNYGIKKGEFSWIGAPSHTKDLNASWQKCFNALENYKSTEARKPTFINASGYFEGQFGIPNIRIASSFINPKLLDYLEDKEKSKCTFGMIMCDHISKKLANYIYRVNF